MILGHYLVVNTVQVHIDLNTNQPFFPLLAQVNALILKRNIISLGIFNIFHYCSLPKYCSRLQDKLKYTYSLQSSE